MSRRVATALAVALVLTVVGCGGSDDDPPSPRGPLFEALASTGGGSDTASLGVGWARPDLVRDAGYPAELIADALGPNAGSVIEERAALRRHFGLDPLAAERLVSVGGSYAFGLRADGIGPGRLPLALTAAGLRERRHGGVLFVESGRYAQVPLPLLDAGVRGLGAFDAFTDDAVVLAISKGARESLLGEGERLSEQPAYRGAAECLGEDVVAARMVPDKLLLSTEQGIDLIAVGVSDSGEALCALGDDAERADQIADNLEASLAANARDPDSGEAIGNSVAGVQVSRRRIENVEVVRAELSLTPRQPPGYVLDLLARGAVVDLINASQSSVARMPASSVAYVRTVSSSNGSPRPSAAG